MRARRLGRRAMTLPIDPTRAYYALEVSWGSRFPGLRETIAGALRGGP